MMKNIYLLLFFLLISVVTFAQQNTKNMIVSVEKKEEILKQIKKKKAYLIDVRTPEEYKSGHLKNATNINYQGADFKTQISKLRKNKTVYLYCRSGNRSGKAADTLKLLGFNKYENIGGFADLLTAGLPVE